MFCSNCRAYAALDGKIRSHQDLISDGCASACQHMLRGCVELLRATSPAPYLVSEGVSCHDDAFPRPNKQQPSPVTLLRNGAAPQTAAASCIRLCNNLLHAALQPQWALNLITRPQLVTHSPKIANQSPAGCHNKWLRTRVARKYNGLSVDCRE